MLLYVSYVAVITVGVVVCVADVITDCCYSSRCCNCSVVVYAITFFDVDNGAVFADADAGVDVDITIIICVVVVVMYVAVAHV